MSMYSSARFSSHKRVRAVFIGRRLMIMTALFVVLSVVTFSLGAVAAKRLKSAGAAFNKFMISEAIPIVAAAKAKTNGGICAAVKNIFSFDALDNFEVFPVFCDISRFRVDQPGTETDEPTDADNSVQAAADYATGTVRDSTNPSKGLEMKNETSYSIDADALSGSKLNIRLDHKNPEILIVHTHASESYTQSEKYHYTQSDYSRCQDTRYNVVRVGDELDSELTKRGFNVIHDKTINDYPSYNNSYNKTLEVIKSNLEKYPTIRCVFDVHRDAVVGANDEKIKFTADINGEKVSQVMIVCGSDMLGLENPNWQKNLALALKIQSSINKKYPGLMRPVNLRKERFNMHMTEGSLIFEFGTHGNTLDEALGAVKYLADGIADVLK